MSGQKTAIASPRDKVGHHVQEMQEKRKRTRAKAHFNPDWVLIKGMALANRKKPQRAHGCVLSPLSLRL